MSKFEIDEAAIMINSPRHPDRNGEECTIVGIDVISTLGRRIDYGIVYKNIPTHAAGFWCVMERQLRKKKPPRISKDVEETRQKGTGDWNLMPWRPEKELEEVE